MNNFSPILQKLREKPVLIGLGAIALLSLIIAIPKGKPRNLDTPADALIGHWLFDGSTQHECYRKDGKRISYNERNGQLLENTYTIQEQNVKEFYLDLTSSATYLVLRFRFKDKGKTIEQTAFPYVAESDEPLSVMRYVDDNVEKCGRK